MQVVLASLFDRLIRIGRLTVHWPDGGTDCFGPGGGPEGGPGSNSPSAALRLRDRGTIRRLILNPGLAIGEAYMDGGLTPVGCDIRDVLALLLLNLSAGGSHAGLATRRALRRTTRWLRRSNSPSRSRRNVAHHYDLDHTLYRLFLDRDMQYSCAFFPRGDETLDAAQAAKKRLIAAKLLLDRPGLRVLDIGCGWGGLALTLAREHGAHVTGITLSAEQLAIARARAQAEGLSHRVSFELRDYRLEDGRYDRVVSVGMFEHVGPNNYDGFFATVRRCLRPDGIALLHAIGNSGPPSTTNPWLAKYIFPGGYSPALSEVFPALERSGLIATDIEVLRLHYATTLRHWQARFAANRAAIARLYDERFCRMFEFYLAGCELAFRHGGEMVFQIQMAARLDAVPLARGYLIDHDASPMEAAQLQAAD